MQKASKRIGIARVGLMGHDIAMAEELDASRTTAEAIRETYAKACADGHAGAAVPQLIGFMSERT